jgi:hypothetical protein
VGRDGTELASDQAKVKEAFDRTAAKIEAHTKRFYLLSYCTPARKGDHEVKIVANAKNPNGSGALEWKFNADGFGPPPDCDPKAPPTFDLKTVTTADDRANAPTPTVGVKASVKASGTVK